MKRILGFVTIFCVTILVHETWADDSASLGGKIVAFCVKHKGQQVEDGECSSLASAALKEAGAKGMGADSPNAGDYTWGDLVYSLQASTSGLSHTGKLSDVNPGDVVQFRDARFVTKTGNRTSIRACLHHTAIIQKTSDSGKTLHVLHQNSGGQRIVQEGTIQLASMTEGWLQIYKPILSEK